MKKEPFFFHSLGFSRNPFGSLTNEEWADIAVLPEVITKAFADDSSHLQFLGEKGQGKTTALLKLTSEFKKRAQKVVYESLRCGQQHFETAIDDLDVFVLDEAQRLSWWQRRHLLKMVRQNESCRLILSSHQDLRYWFAYYRLPLITIQLENHLTYQHWRTLLARRLAYFALPNADYVTLAPDAVRYLYETFGHDLRAGEWFLYEVWQRLENVEVLGAEKLSSHQS